MPSGADDSAAGMRDRIEIRELIENWVLWRDAGDWDRFATVWHDDGRMNATWFKSSASDFIAGCKKAFDAGMIGLHSLGGGSIDLQGSRAVAQTRMQIVQRALVHDVLVDVRCEGRFVDALEKREGRWGMVLRQPVYELDRMSPVDPSATLSLDPEILAAYPEGYRYLAYLQSGLGFDVSRTLPGTRGPEIAALMDRLNGWLGGADRSTLGD